MARSALGAILAGLGGGLTGYAQEQQRRREEMDRNRQRTLQEALNAASLMNEGWESPEAFARRQERVGRPAVRDVAALSRFAMNPLGQPAPAVAPEGFAGIAEAQRITGGPAGRVQIGERELVLPMGTRDQSMIDRALAGAERRMEGQMEAGRRRGELEFASQLRREEQAQAEGERRRTSQVNIRSTGLSPNDRAYQAVLQYARTPIRDMLGEERLPTDEEVQAYAARAKAAESAVYGTGSPVRQPSGVERRRPGETIAQYLARTGLQ